MGPKSRSASPQQICAGCQKIETHLIREWRNALAADASFKKSKECCIHDSYQSIEVGANNGCLTCRAFRRSLLQHQITWKAARELSSFKGPVCARLSPKNDPPGSEFLLEITVTPNHDDDHNDFRTARFLCTSDTDTIARRAPCNLPNSSEADSIIQQIKGWTRECHENHHDCNNLRWSMENPTLLIEILSSDRLRLVSPPKSPLLKYSALSYSWGTRDKLSVDENAKIEHAKTRRENSSSGWRANIDKRRDRFSVHDLPEAMRDAITLSRRLDIPYIWIDQVCIGDAEDWNHEASKMHEVYGNAHVTICACATEKATVGLFDRRTAWDHPEEPCTLDDLRLLEYDMSLKEVRLEAPIFHRAWILQEERLSPRTIYWCSQRAYWSCLKSQRSEMPADVAMNPAIEPFERKIPVPSLLSPQGFMKMRWKGETQSLHAEWLDLVQDFTKRAIYDSADIYPAMSGLATQYLQAFIYDDEVSKRQEYLGGLWRDTFARDLTWSVTKPRNPYYKNTEAPHWSWASLPSETLINTKHNFETCSDFKLLEPSRVKSGEGAFEVIKRGAEICAVRVQGRLRKFAPKESKIVEWHHILQSDPERPKFKLDVYSNNVVARNIERGEVLSYEVNKEQVTARLDYAEDYGDLRELYCLEVGKSSMLILVAAQKPRTIGVPAFVRIGAGHGFRPNFFNDSVPVQELDLVARARPARARLFSVLVLLLHWLLLPFKLMFKV